MRCQIDIQSLAKWGFWSSVVPHLEQMQHRQTDSSFAPAISKHISIVHPSCKQGVPQAISTPLKLMIHMPQGAKLKLTKMRLSRKIPQFQPSISPCNCGIQHGNSILLLVRKHTPTTPDHSRNYLVILRIRHVSLAPHLDHLGKYIIPVSKSLPMISHGGFPLKVQAIAGPDEVVHLGIASNACNNNSLVDSHCWSLGNAKLGLQTSMNSRGTKWIVG